MKIKKRYIIILIIIVFVCVLGFIFNKNDIQISSTSNKEYKEANLNFEDSEEYESQCLSGTSIENAYDKTTSIFKDIKNGKYYQIIDAKYTDLGYSGFVFLINGCTYDSKGFIDTYKSVGGTSNSVCDAYKSGATNEYSANSFNASICVTEYGYEKVKASNTCSIEWDQNEEDGFEGAYFKVDGSTQTLDYYIDKCGCSTALKYFVSADQKNIYNSKCDDKITENNKCEYKATIDSTGYKTKHYYYNGIVIGENCSSWKSDDTEKDGTDRSLGDYYYYGGNPDNAKCYYNYSQENTGKTCNYGYDEDNNLVYLVNGCSWDLSSYLNKCEEVGENKCDDSTLQSYLAAALSNKSAYSSQLKTYNTKCGNKIDYGTVIVHQNDDAYGLSCDNGWEYNGIGSCKKSVTSGETFIGPTTTNLLKYGTRKFKGWSTDKSCSTYTSGNSFYVDFTGDKTYYACYEEEADNSSLYGTTKYDNYLNDSSTYHTLPYSEKKEINEGYKVENGTCNSTNITLTDKYYKRTTDLYESTLSTNKYCTVVCEDNIDVSYPSIFETVAAGQYFELMYEPEITATRTCTSQFDYDNWKDAYGNAIDNEIKLMNEVNKAEADLAAAKALEKPTVLYNNCNCGLFGCTDKKYEDTKRKSYYTSTGQRSSSTPQTASGCGSSAFESSRSSTISAAEAALSSAKEKYETAVNKRIQLEQANLQCYSILDQDNNNTKKYKDVFKENYTQVSSINETTYQIKSSKVSIASSNDSTSSTYASYITSETDIDDNTTELRKTGVANTISTANFYAVYPKLTFEYDDGSDGKPTNLNVSEKLDVEAHVKLDTGSFTDKTVSGSDTTYTKNNTSINICENFYVKGTQGNHICFDAYTAKSVTRKVEYYFVLHESTEYLSKLHTGETKVKDAATAGYVTLSREEKYTNKSGTSISLLNHVYPVSLKAIADTYKNKFTLTDENSNYLNVSSYQKSFNSSYFSGFTGKYECAYDITNDALITSNNSNDYKNLKRNTIFRSVATDDIDPNDRALYGNLGENWTNTKGQAAMNQIQTTEKTGSTTKNTYNPDNLEYSFTLTPSLINAIQDYNDSRESYGGYDDFNLTCATTDGRECVSKFLTELSEGKVDGTVVQSAYSDINSWGKDDLFKARKKWKYYHKTSNSIIEETAAVNAEGTITSPAMTLDAYLTRYELWGVLP